MINTILLVVIIVWLITIFLFYRSSNENKLDPLDKCPNLTCPEVSCPKPECPEPKCPEPVCPKTHCPEVSCPRCPKMPPITCPEPVCPKPSCPSTKDLEEKIAELEQENICPTLGTCPTTPPMKSKIVFKPKIIKKFHLAFLAKGKTGNEKINITYNGVNKIVTDLELDTEYNYYSFKIPNHEFVDSIEITNNQDSIIEFKDREIIFNLENVLDKEIRYYSEDGNLIYTQYPETQEQCKQGILSKNGYLKIYTPKESNLDLQYKKINY